MDHHIAYMYVAANMGTKMKTHSQNVPKVLWPGSSGVGCVAAEAGHVSSPVLPVSASVLELSIRLQHKTAHNTISKLLQEEYQHSHWTL